MLLADNTTNNMDEQCCYKEQATRWYQPVRALLAASL
jgi:hypothetical protein